MFANSINLTTFLYFTLNKIVCNFFLKYLTNKMVQRIQMVFSFKIVILKRIQLETIYYFFINLKLK